MDSIKDLINNWDSNPSSGKEELIIALEHRDKLLLDRAKQMLLEQKTKMDIYSNQYNAQSLGIVEGIERIVKLIERHVK